MNLLGAVIALSWAFSLSPDAFLSIVIALLVFWSRSVPVSLLLLLSLNLVAFIQATLGGKKSGSGYTQKRYAITFLGIFTALFGSSLTGMSVSYPLIFFGLLLALSSGFTLLFFNRHYEQLTLKAYISSSLIPSLVAINILLKIKTEMKADYSQVWDISLLVLGLFTFVYSSLLAASKERLKPVLIYLSQTWVGLLLFLSVIDYENMNLIAFASISVFTVTSLVMLNCAWQLGDRYYSFAKMSFLGLPGLVGLTALYFAIRMTIGMNISWLLVLGFGYILNAITLIRSRPGVVRPDRKINFRFWIVTAVQIASGVGLYLMERGGVR